VFQRLSRHGLKLRTDKCQFLQRQVKFLGHVVDKSGISPDPEKTAAVQGWPVPSTVREVRAFLGLAGYYRRFIVNFARMAQPLNALLVGVSADKKSSSRKVEWSTDCQDAFVKLKTCLTQAPILAYADFSLPFVLYTDASHQGLGAVLSQIQEGQERVIAYASRSLHPAERNNANYRSFNTIERECLAIKWAVPTLRYYLLGRAFTICSDHAQLQWLHRMKDTNERITRWYLPLQPFKFEVVHRLGAQMVMANFFSRQ
ncbi:hypothetical protein C0J50_11334, partial [Silurus asotus]